jgi:leader peptidase (prepilin peptidase)/N-methyltransferase
MGIGERASKYNHNGRVFRIRCTKQAKGTINMNLKDRKTAMYFSGSVIILFVWLVMFIGELSVFSLIKSALLIILSYIAMIFDITTKKIPNGLVLIMIAGWLVLMTSMMLYDIENGIILFMDSIYGLLIGGGLFLLVYLISRKGLGGGDVKFMAAAGLYLGFSETVPAILYGTVLAALVGLVLILLKKIGRKDTMPLAPFLFAGIMITVFTK